MEHWTHFPFWKALAFFVNVNRHRISHALQTWYSVRKWLKPKFFKLTSRRILKWVGLWRKIAIIVAISWLRHKLHTVAVHCSSNQLLSLGPCDVLLADVLIGKTYYFHLLHCLAKCKFDCSEGFYTALTAVIRIRNDIFSYAR